MSAFIKSGRSNLVNLADIEVRFRPKAVASQHCDALLQQSGRERKRDYAHKYEQ